ncbi:MAG: hypothetical protein JWN32_717 [Solirubrobacterales bacterium]|nr:hypothetical protein [Solirubrobacterales bacterium]
MTEQTASRTLVKSPPELWAEVSDAGSLARHLGEFGEIRITRLEGESTVAWEGERASGTVELTPSGWGTRVTLTARNGGEGPEPQPEPLAEPEPEPVAEAPEPEPEPVGEPEPPRRGLFARLMERWRAVAAEPEPAVAEPVAEETVAEEEPPPRLTPAPEPDPETLTALTSALDSLGAAHHRPFSRG